MLNNIGLSITGFLSLSTVTFSSNMIVGETATRKKAISPSCSYTAVVIPFSFITSSILSSFKAFSALGFMLAHKKRYKHSNIAAKISNILPKGIILTNDKILVKTAYLA